jgi:hypothetical protein
MALDDPLHLSVLLWLGRGGLFPILGQLGYVFILLHAFLYHFESLARRQGTHGDDDLVSILVHLRHMFLHLLLVISCCFLPVISIFCCAVCRECYFFGLSECGITLGKLL